MSSCTFFVFFSLIEYAFVNVMLGDISDVERKDKTSHLRNILVTANANLPVLSKHPSQQQYIQAGGYKVLHSRAHCIRAVAFSGEILSGLFDGIFTPEEILL